MKNGKKRFEGIYYAAKTTWDAWRLIKFNIKPITIFVIIFTIAGSVLGYNFNKALQSIYRYIINVPFVGDFSAKQYYLNPLFIVEFLLSLLGLTFLSMVEIGALTRAVRLSRHGKKADLKDMVAEGLNDACRFLRPRNWLLAVLITIVMPFINAMRLTNLNVNIEVPGFIQDFINANVYLRPLYYIVMIALVLVSLYFIYSIRIFADTELDFISSCKKSISVIKGNYLRTVLTLLLVELAIAALIYGTGGLIAITVYYIMKYSDVYASIDGTAMDAAKDIVSFAGYMQMFIMPAVNIATLSSLYYKICRDRDIMEPESIEGYGLRKDTKIIAAIAGVLMLVCCICMYDSSQWLGFLNLKTDMPQIIAHRGDSARCPENTIHAFELALEEDVDWIELDVHQTKDGVIIVSHDENLARICGKDVNVHDLTYKEIRELEVGSWFSKEFEGTKLSTLDEILRLCKDKANVQIEIKPTADDKDIEQAVIDVIKDTGMEDQVVVLSLKTAPIEKIEELDPEINTMYCTVIAFGDVSDAPGNWISVEEHNIDHALVEKVHQAGKSIFAWTVNNPDSVQHLVDCGVDGILTDDPIMMAITLNQCDYTQRLFSRFVDFIGAWEIRFF